MPAFIIKHSKYLCLIISTDSRALNGQSCDQETLYLNHFNLFL